MKLKYFMVAALFLTTGMVIEAKKSSATGSNLVTCTSSSQCPNEDSCVNGICIEAAYQNYVFQKSQQPAIAPSSVIRGDVKAKLKDKATCTSNSQCKSGMCSIQPGQTSGICAPKSKVGSTCYSDQQCRDGYCEKGKCKKMVL